MEQTTLNKILEELSITIVTDPKTKKSKYVIPHYRRTNYNLLEPVSKTMLINSPKEKE